MAANAQTQPLPVRWIHGSESAKHNTDPDIQVYAHDEHTVILRQNKAIDYEAPFLYLLFGDDRALLIDTGATADPELFPLRRVVDELLAERLTRHPQEDYELLVVHTHAHGDHIAGDGQFADRPQTTVIGAQRSAAWEFFGFGPDPEAVGRVDLGGRVLECLPTPGHHDSSVTFYDPWTGFLLTGDTIYRGRLYIQDWPAFARSIDRLIEFCDTRPVSHVLGCHIEMTRQPGVDYPVRTTYQPDEPPLEMTVDHLHRIRAAIDEIGETATRRAFDEFVIWPNQA
ncbi:MAG TPA: MBL fold metallo-hydrolase [Actinocrinis sp.]|nr:MBL fold metallo-hydrolase [Actinocrinis sp.]